MKITLRGYISNHIGKTIKVGSASSFFFCGKIGDKTLQTIEELSNKQDQSNKRRLKEYTGKKKEFEQQKKKIKALEVLADKFVKNPRVKASISRCIRDISIAEQNVFTQLEKITAICDVWVPFLDRPIKEMYPSIENPKTTIIILDGVENGKYWNEDEYKNNKGEEIEPDGDNN